jgi:hypothetical protein
MGSPRTIWSGGSSVSPTLGSGSKELAACGADLLSSLLMGRYKPLLAPILAEEAGSFHLSLEATVQLLERFAWAGVHGHTGSFSAPV